MALTETWLGTDVDNIVLGDLIPDGYDLYHVPRQHQRGGGGSLNLQQKPKLKQNET